MCFFVISFYPWLFDGAGGCRPGALSFSIDIGGNEARCAEKVRFAALVSSRVTLIARYWEIHRESTSSLNITLASFFLAGIVAVLAVLESKPCFMIDFVEKAWSNEQWLQTVWPKASFVLKSLQCRSYRGKLVIVKALTGRCDSKDGMVPSVMRLLWAGLQSPVERCSKPHFEGSTSRLQGVS